MAAGTTTDSVLELIAVVASVELFHRITVSLVKFAPCTVMAVSPVPAGIG